MCGITGIYNFDSQRNVDQKLLMNMNNVLKHRGPDSEGYHIDKNFGFGMRRLSIIDLAGSNQPVFNRDKSVAIVFNGEIYNFKEVRRVLENKGYVFNTDGDAEVILYAYEEYNDKFLKELNGMFAIAIWDSKQRKLLLARDRLGEKPLYYYIDDEKLIFGSEIKAIMEVPNISKEIDNNSLDLYLSYMYIPAPYSIFKKIRKLPPANFLVCINGDVEIKEYWGVDYSFQSRKPISELVEDFRYLFDESVRMRMISDVPLGALLSGGIDSSSIVASMSKASTNRIKTFSIGFKNIQDKRYYDETKYAKIVSDIFDTEHTEFEIEADVVKMLPDYIYHFDEPFADYAAFPTYMIAKLARQQVTVVLTGDGGDEVFAGYKRYRTELALEIYRNLPEFSRQGLSGVLDYMYQHVDSNSRIKNILGSALKKSLLSGTPSLDRYIKGLEKFNSEDKKQLLKHKYLGAPDFNLGEYRHYVDGVKGLDFMTQVLHLDMKTLLPEDMLTKVDRATMATSLEARVPYLDHRLVELAASIPLKEKITMFTTKKFLKRAFKGLLPDEIINRPKHGFSSPIDRWLRFELKEYMQDVLSENSIGRVGYFNYRYVQMLKQEHIEGKNNWGEKLFMIMVFQMWYDRFVKKI